MDPAPLGWRLAARSRGARVAPSRPPRQESFRLLRRAVAFYLDGPIVLRRIEVCQRPEHPRRLRLGFSMTIGTPSLTEIGIWRLLGTQIPRGPPVMASAASRVTPT